MIIAAVHVYWAVGGAWPAKERAELPQTVVGTEDTRMPPQAITLAVAFLIFMVLNPSERLIGNTIHPCVCCWVSAC